MGRYRIIERDSGGHGDLYELEEEHYFDVVDAVTDKTVMTFENHAFSTMGEGAWQLQSVSGVRSVELAQDGVTLTVRSYDTEVTVTIRLP